MSTEQKYKLIWYTKLILCEYLIKSQETRFDDQKKHNTKIMNVECLMLNWFLLLVKNLPSNKIVSNDFFSYQKLHQTFNIKHSTLPQALFLSKKQPFFISYVCSNTYYNKHPQLCQK